MKGVARDGSRASWVKASTLHVDTRGSNPRGPTKEQREAAVYFTVRDLLRIGGMSPTTVLSAASDVLRGVITRVEIEEFIKRLMASGELEFGDGLMLKMKER